MLRYEIKKVFSKSKNRIAVIVLFVILAITSILTINRVEYVDENGNSSVGISAVRDLREAKNQWAGYLTEDTLSKALEENRTINSSKEALSDDITEQNKAYAKKQGIAGIMDVIICAFSDYRDYNYYGHSLKSRWLLECKAYSRICPVIDVELCDIPCAASAGPLPCRSTT